jgi:RNA-directed DNA polymerase
MKTHKKLYDKLCSKENLYLAYRKARKGKSKKASVIEFEDNLEENLNKLQEELLNLTYKPLPLKRFVIRDPKTRTIHASAFRDRIVHHAIINILEPIFEKIFIYDSYASRKDKGAHLAIKRFDYFQRKVTQNGCVFTKRKENKNQVQGYCLKADIRHYFDTVNHQVLISIIRRKIKDKKVIWLINQILDNFDSPTKGTGMPLGNFTSQFFANVYLNELDQFVKHKLRTKYYIRYVDDFVILYESKEQLEEWKIKINNFLKEKLKIELHPSKSHVLRLNSGINFLGFRVFYHHKLIRASNLKNFERRFNNMRILFDEEIVSREKALESLDGWLAYCSYANTYKYRRYLIRNFNKSFSHGSKLLVHNKRNYSNYIKRVKESELQFSTQKTLFNYKKGLSVKEIAVKAGIKESTVWGHLINLIEYEQLSVWKVLPREKICKILNKIYSHKERLRDIKKRLRDESINYDDIACVMASIKSRRWKKNKKCPVTK